jgi:uncharacterized protein
LVYLQNEAEPTLWFRLAAEQGLAEAQYLVASRYFRGVGVPQDYVQAYIYANLAAAGLQRTERRQRC